MEELNRWVRDCLWHMGIWEIDGGNYRLGEYLLDLADRPCDWPWGVEQRLRACGYGIMVTPESTVLEAGPGWEPRAEMLFRWPVNHWGELYKRGEQYQNKKRSKRRFLHTR